MFCISILVFNFICNVASTKDTTTIGHELQELKQLIGNLILEHEELALHDEDFDRDLTTAERAIQHLTEHTSDRRRALTESQVAFYVKLDTSLTGLGHHEAVKFDTVMTNTFSVYLKDTGIFTAPLSGMFVFSWTADVEHLKAQSTELVVNSRPKAWAYADTAELGNGDHGSSSQTVVLKIAKGDQVWIRTGTQGRGEISGNGYSTFSGFLLFPTR